jgi:hypothetical protein
MLNSVFATTSKIKNLYTSNLIDPLEDALVSVFIKTNFTYAINHNMANKIAFYGITISLLLLLDTGLCFAGVGIPLRILTSFLIGAIIQGPLQCEAQRNLQNNAPGISMLVGGINWSSCCMITKCSISAAPWLLGGGTLATIGSGICISIPSIAICSIAMCAFERIVVGCLPTTPNVENNTQANNKLNQVLREESRSSSKCHSC